MTRFLITGTPLQNNLKELWSLLHFLLPNIFRDWEQFESWFDFSDLEDENTTEEFLQDQMKQDLVKKIHHILQPMLLRRIKADVEHLLPKKREYILYAPLTQEQTDLYNAINDRKTDTRTYLEEKVVQRLTRTTNAPATSRKVNPRTFKSNNSQVEDSDSEADIPLSKLALRNSGKRAPGGPPKQGNVFEQMMAKESSASTKATAKAFKNPKRKSEDTVDAPASKSAKSSRSSTPTSGIRGRKGRKPKTYTEAEPSDEDDLSDDEFEQRLAEEMAQPKKKEFVDEDLEEIERAKTLELASRSQTISL